MHNYNDLLKAVYEIEGLIALQIQRGDNAIAAVDEMIADKIAALAGEFNIDTEKVAEPAETNPLAEEEEFATEAVAESASDDVKEDAPAPAPAIEEEKTDDEAIAASVAVEETCDADVTSSGIQKNEPETPAESPKAIADAFAEREMTLTLDEKLARERARDIFKAFTLNDKFRFRRELFRDSQEEFDDALSIISQMTTIEEAEEYIYNDLCWDPDNDDVKAFMEVVTKHF